MALVEEPELAALIRAFAGNKLGQALPAPAWLQATWQKLKDLFRLLGLGELKRGNFRSLSALWS